MRWIAGIVLGLLAAAMAVVAAGEMILMGPLRSQSAEDIERGYRVSQAAPTVTLVGLLVGIALAVFVWRTSRGALAKALTAAACGVLAFAAYMAQGSFTERMFSPLPEVVRLPAGEATHVEPNDLVLGVSHGGESAAYPVPIIAYHHIVNDRLADEPFVVTY